MTVTYPLQYYDLSTDTLLITQLTLLDEHSFAQADGSIMLAFGLKCARQVVKRLNQIPVILIKHCTLQR